MNVIDVKHAKNFGLPNVEPDFYSWIDRLQVHCEWKYPNRKWTNDIYYGIAFQWKSKYEELKERVLKLESEMNKSKNL
ncbi:hypothetical protein [Tenacibaculum sp. 190524A02b]|uniref:hypothetical protein n=1 Tax=Tenacibaculum vairaonense TaxID=3137860 RepID=UPI0031FB6DAB